jgi:hypothetical protein
MSARMLILSAGMAAALAAGGCAERRSLAENVVTDDPRFAEPVVGTGRPFFVYDAEPVVIQAHQPNGSIATVVNDDPRYVYDAEPLWQPPPGPQTAAAPSDYYREQIVILRK